MVDWAPERYARPAEEIEPSQRLLTSRSLVPTGDWIGVKRERIAPHATTVNVNLDYAPPASLPPANTGSVQRYLSQAGDAFYGLILRQLRAENRQ